MRFSCAIKLADFLNWRACLFAAFDVSGSTQITCFSASSILIQRPSLLPTRLVLAIAFGRIFSFLDRGPTQLISLYASLLCQNRRIIGLFSLHRVYLGRHSAHFGPLEGLSAVHILMPSLVFARKEGTSESSQSETVGFYQHTAIIVIIRFVVVYSYYAFVLCMSFCDRNLQSAICNLQSAICNLQLSPYVDISCNHQYWCKHTLNS